MWDLDLASTMLILAQDGAAPPAPGEGVPVEGAPGGPGGGAGGAPPPGSFTKFFPLILLLLVGMILFSVFGQRRDRKKREAMVKAVKKHDRVQTIGGVIGSIVEIKSNTVVLKVDESSNTRITFARSAIQQVLATDQDSEGEPSL